MITFTNKHNSTFDEVALSDAIEWYAKLKGVKARTHKTIYADLKGYPEVYVGGKHVHMYVSRLLMMYHLKRELGSNEFVHHIDGNRLNNVLSNLALTSRAAHPRHHRKRADISNHTIKEMLEQGMSYNDAARQLGCSDAAICHRVKGMRKKGEI